MKEETKCMSQKAENSVLRLEEAYVWLMKRESMLTHRISLSVMKRKREVYEEKKREEEASK